MSLDLTHFTWRCIDPGFMANIDFGSCPKTDFFDGEVPDNKKNKVIYKHLKIVWFLLKTFIIKSQHNDNPTKKHSVFCLVVIFEIKKTGNK